MTVVEFLGGPREVSGLVGKHISRVYRWMKPSDAGGMDGVIPAKDQRKLLHYAQQVGADLRPEDFFASDRLRKVLVSAKEAA